MCKKKSGSGIHGSVDKVEPRDGGYGDAHFRIMNGVEYCSESSSISQPNIRFGQTVRPVESCVQTRIYKIMAKPRLMDGGAGGVVRAY